MLAEALEVMGITENRYSGIPTIRRELQEYGLAEPEFLDERGSFIVKFYKEVRNIKSQERELTKVVQNPLLFCKTPWTRKEICEYLGLTSVMHTIQTHIMPLVEQGLIKLSIPDRPSSSK